MEFVFTIFYSKTLFLKEVSKTLNSTTFHFPGKLSPKPKQNHQLFFRCLTSFSLVSINSFSARKTFMAMLARFSKPRNYIYLCRITRNFTSVSAPLLNKPFKTPFQGMLFSLSLFSFSFSLFFLFLIG